jgi:hypothetical protein
MRRFPFRWILLLFFAATSLWAGWYVYQKGFGKRWRGTLSKEFQRYGLEISVRRLTLDPFRGLIAKDLKIYDGPRRRAVFAEISDIALDINYANLLQHEPALNAIDLRNARIAIPLDPGAPEKDVLRITNFHARIYFLPGRIEIRQAAGIYSGVQINASGVLLNPAQFRLPAPKPGISPRFSGSRWVKDILTEWSTLQFVDREAQMDLTFQADLARPASFRIDSGRLTAAHLSRHDYQLQNLEVRFRLANLQLDVERIFVRDSGGELFARGAWNFASGERSFQARSSLALGEMFDTDSRLPWLANWHFELAPAIELSGQLAADDTLNLVGKCRFEQFSVDSVPFQRLRAEFSRSGDRWMITNAEVTHRSGTISGDVMQVPTRFQLRLNGSMNPTEMMPLFPERVRKALSQWEFLSSPVVQASFNGPAPNLETLHGAGRIWLGRTKFRGAAFNAASADFQLKDGVVRYADVRVDRDDGGGSGAFSYDFKRNEVTFDQVQTAIDPAALATWIHPEVVKLLEPLTFSLTPRIKAGGRVQFVDGSTNQLRISVQIPGAFSFRYGKLTLPFDAGDVTIEVLPEEIEIESFEARIANGKWRQRSHLRFPLANGDYRSLIQLDRVQPARLDLPPLRGFRGLLTGSIELLGGERVSAWGSLLFQDAALASTPLFAPLVATLTPYGYREPVDASLGVRLRRGLMELNSVTIRSGAHLLELSGSIGILTGRVDFSGSFDQTRIRGEGPLASPIWRVLPTGESEQ